MAAKKEKKGTRGEGNAAGCVIWIGMLVWVLIGVFSFFMFEWAVSETSMLVLLVVGGDDEGTRLWFPRGEERANTVSYQPMDATMLVPAICRVLGGGEKQGGEEKSRFDSIRVSWSERRCGAVLFIAGRRKKAAPGQSIY